MGITNAQHNSHKSFESWHGYPSLGGNSSDLCMILMCSSPMSMKNGLECLRRCEKPTKMPRVPPDSFLRISTREMKASPPQGRYLGIPTEPEHILTHQTLCFSLCPNGSRPSDQQTTKLQQWSLTMRSTGDDKFLFFRHLIFSLSLRSPGCVDFPKLCPLSHAVEVSKPLHQLYKDLKHQHF